MAIELGTRQIRAESIDKSIVLLAKRQYKFKQLCMVKSDSADAQKYWIEPATDITGATGAAVQGIPRGAGFPHGETSWTPAVTYQLKHGLETIMYWEDILNSEIDVVTRTVQMNARAVVKSVDANIFGVLTESGTPDAINTFAIPVGEEWDSATLANQNPIQNLLDSRKMIDEDDYDSSNAWLLLNPKNYANLLGNASVRNAGQFYSDSVSRNGRVGNIVGLTIIVSNNVTTDKAVIVVGKSACTWIQGAPLRTVTTEEAGISRTVRSWEWGVAQLRNPLQVVYITNTDA